MNWNNIFLCFIKRKLLRLPLHEKFYVKHKKVLRANVGSGIRTTVGKHALCISGCGSWNLCHVCLCLVLSSAIFIKYKFLQTNFKINWRINVSISTIST